MEFSVNGRYLLILDPDAVPEALDTANICKHKNYGSFQRQCCIYGWRRIAQPEVPKLVLDDDEEPGATIARIGENIKVMMHENLTRDSPREEVRSVTRKAKPKPSRAKDAEARAVANERMAAEQAEREARQQKQAELVAIHRQEEKQRQEEQKRREQMKHQPEDEEVNLDDLTYDPALPPAPPLSTNIVLDPSLASLTGSLPGSGNALTAAATIPKQANGNTPGAKKSKNNSKKRKNANNNNKSEDRENAYSNGDIRVNEEMAKRAKKKHDNGDNDVHSIPFDANGALASLGIHPNTYNTVSLGQDNGTESASANFENFFANAFDPSNFTSVPAPSLTANANTTTAQQLGVAPSGTHFEALPKSLQEAFLIIDNKDNEQNSSNASSNSSTPAAITNNNTNAVNTNNMIDPSLASFDTASLPPLPPSNGAPASSQTAPTYPNSVNPSTIQQTPTFTSMSGLENNYNLTSSPAPSTALSNNINNTTVINSLPSSSFYYQSAPIDPFSDPTYDPNLPQSNVVPPYFSSAFSGLADLQATNW